MNELSPVVGLCIGAVTAAAIVSMMILISILAELKKINKDK